MGMRKGGMIRVEWRGMRKEGIRRVEWRGMWKKRMSRMDGNVQKDEFILEWSGRRKGMCRT